MNTDLKCMTWEGTHGVTVMELQCQNLVSSELQVSTFDPGAAAPEEELSSYLFYFVFLCFIPYLSLP